MIGYYGVDDAPSDGDGWLRTADVGHLDDDGDLWITDRAAAIIRGGEEIVPVAVDTPSAALRAWSRQPCSRCPSRPQRGDHGGARCGG
jgi:long-subunit acyl-CoA synthetase (AMP-forming)